jgi:peroxiredoxin
MHTRLIRHTFFLVAALAIGLYGGLLSGCGGEPGGESTAEKLKESAETGAPAESKTPIETEAPSGLTQVASVGWKAPDFVLSDLDGGEHRLSDYTAQGKVVVLEWFNPDCPFVMKHHKNSRSMAETHAAASSKGVVWLAINSGAQGRQGHGLDRNRQAKSDYGITYPILLDESGKVGKSYRAKTTPHMFIVDAKGYLVYDGAIDNEPDIQKLGTNHVRAALEELFAGKEITVNETKPYGCSVKYPSP